VFTQSHQDNPWAPDYIYKNGINAKLFGQIIPLKRCLKVLLFKLVNLYFLEEKIFMLKQIYMNNGKISFPTCVEKRTLGHPEASILGQ